MNISGFFKSNWQHFAVLGVFLVIMFVYFQPEFDGYGLKQHDVEQFKGMANETEKFREKYGEEPLWTNSMFGGMPTTQISTLYKGNIFQSAIIGFLRTFGVPSGIFLLHLIGFYILALCLKVRPLVALIGSLAFAFASYEIVILQAGHNSKATTVALMAPVLGAFIMAFRSNWKWGAILSALFMTFELASNHLQVTYYLAILLFAIGFYELIKALRTKEIRKFVVTSTAVIAAYILAVFINYGNITLTQDYAKHTIRGGNDVSIMPDGTPSEINTSGLDKDYITNWSYGIGESWTLISPYIKGSASVGIADSKFRDMLENSDRSPQDINAILNAPYPLYWGEQPITSGPVYVGVIMLLIMTVGLYYLNDKRKWVFFAVAILALMLSWGKNYMGLTDFFIEHVPGYNKFRTVTIILVLIELIVPVLVVLTLEKIITAREELKQNKKPFLIISGGILVLLLGLKIMGLGDYFSNNAEREQLAQIPELVMNQIASMPPEQLAQNGIDINNQNQIQAIISQQEEQYGKQFELMKGFREEIFNSSINRSILFLILGAGVLSLFFYTSVSSVFVTGGLAVFVLMDFIPVDLNYLNNSENDKGEFKYWIPIEEKHYPLIATQADMQILEMEQATNPQAKNAIESGKKLGEQKAIELGYTGAMKNRVVESYAFSELNFATNYRVFDYNNPWGSSRSSYFHKNLGGYHGAKLRNIQNLFEFQMSRSNNMVFDMLNIKYFIQGDMARPNPNALGNAWFIQKIKSVESANEEILSLGNVFSLQNTGNGKLLINGVTQKESTVFGGEKIQYLETNDTMDVPLSNGLTKGMKALFVKDINGKTNLIPAQTMQQDSLNSFNALVEIELTDEFNPKDEGVMLTEHSKSLKKTTFSGEGEVKMLSYKPNEIVYSSKTKADEFAVFSEIYYPNGWTAYIDGKETNIFKVNYLLRGLEIPKGEHKIEFKFEIPKYNKATWMAYSGTALLVLLIGGMLFVERKNNDTGN